MKRRDFFAQLAGALVVPLAMPTSPTHFGLLTVDGHRQHEKATGENLHVWLDGEDVTACCAEADDVDGSVVLVMRDEATYRRWLGRGTHDADHRLRVRGTVRIAPGGPIR